MPENDSQKGPSDLLGIKEFGKATNTLAKGAVEGFSALFSRICLPAAEELGDFLRDKVKNWRAYNIIKISKYTDLKLEAKKDVSAHPRIVFGILESGSWCDDEILQKSWAGLLAASCSKEPSDDRNLPFVSLLEKLTAVQVKMLNHICEHAPKFKTPANRPIAKWIKLTLKEIQKVSGIEDTTRLEWEFAALTQLGLIGEKKYWGLDTGGFEYDSSSAILEPTPLALHLFVKCQGFGGSPIDYWKIDQSEPKNYNPCNVGKFSDIQSS
ncbi:hypothetical protein V2O64_01950 [Verrucomicrobiaceae bacterium 227]